MMVNDGDVPPLNASRTAFRFLVPDEEVKKDPQLGKLFGEVPGILIFTDKASGFYLIMGRRPTYR